MSQFTDELVVLLDKGQSCDPGSIDFILSRFLLNCLKWFNEIVKAQQRDDQP